MNNSELIDRVNAVTSCMSYDEPAKGLIREMCHRLGSRTIRIKRVDGKLCAINLYGKATQLSLSEKLLWLIARIPPKGFEVCK